MRQPEPIVMYDSPEAATLRNVSGWVSRRGLFYGDQGEDAARYDGCTHRNCRSDGCAEAIEKCRLYCRKCEALRDANKHTARERRAPVDGEWLYSHTMDRYAPSLDELQDYWECDAADDDVFDPEKLQIVICEGRELRQLDDDYWTDDLPEDGELPDAVEKALDALNAAISAHGTVAYWPTEVAAAFDDSAINAVREAKP